MVITASSDTLMRQAPMTVGFYLGQAVKDIDEVFGPGYAKKHPELVGEYLRSCAIDLQTGVMARAIETLAEAVESASGWAGARSGYEEK